MSSDTTTRQELTRLDGVRMRRLLRDVADDTAWAVSGDDLNELCDLGIRALDDLIATRAELDDMRRVVTGAVVAMRQCNWSVSGLPGCITDALDRVPLTYEDERSVGERETYTAIRALVATANTEQEPRR